MNENGKNSGEEDVVATALAENQDRLYALVSMMMARQTQDVMDVLQTVNQHVLLHSESFDVSKPFWPWLKTIAVNAVMTYFRKGKKEILTVDSELVDKVGERMADDRRGAELDREDYFDALQACLSKLSPLKRDLLQERYSGGMTVERMARAHSVSASSLGTMICRLRQALRRCIEKFVAGRRSGKETGAEDGAFERTVDLFLDGTLPQDDRERFIRRLLDSPEELDAYIGEAFLHAFLECRRRQLFPQKGGTFSSKPVYRISARAALIAAAWAALLTGGALLLRRGEPRRLPPVAETRRAPVVAEGGRTQPKTIEKAAPAPQAAIAAAKPASVPVFVETKSQLAVEKPPQKEEEKPMNIASIKSSVATTAAVATAALLTSAQKAALAASESNVPVVSNVTFRQPFGTRMLEIGYTLANGPGIVTVDITTNGVSIGDANITFLKGEVNKVVQGGTYTVLWDTKYAWPNHTNEQARAVVTAWATNCPPDYMVVDLNNGTNIHYYTSVAALPDGGLTNATYRNTRIVMRKIPAAGVTWTMGSIDELWRNSANEASHSVTLANDYYISIYEVTQAQWAKIYGDRPSSFYNESDWAGPVENVSYNTIRGSDSSSYYPAAPASASFLSLLRAKTGQAFDLPSEAQWEYACRAGNYEGKWGDGSGYTNPNEDANLNALARYYYNDGRVKSGTDYLAPAGNCNASNATAIVGSYRPNSWGLYDMHGNVWEWCLDWYAGDITSLGGAVNTNYTSNSKRVARGGAFHEAACLCRSADRNSINPAGDVNSFCHGFRLVIPLE